MEKEAKQVRVALVDDHVLLRNALATMINNFGECRVISQANHGREFCDQFLHNTRPELAILDLNMPYMNGLEVAEWLRVKYPDVKVLMLTMYDSDLTLIRLLQAGVKGFLKKDVSPAELKFAIYSIMDSGFYYSTHTTGRIVNLFRQWEENKTVLEKALLNTNELEFLKLACSDLTYKEVAIKMKLNPRAVDNLRDSLFTKLDVRSRVGLVMFAIRHGIVCF